jgi:hypothetical protein
MLAEMKRSRRLVPKMIRLPQADVDRIKEIAQAQSKEDVKVTESDVVREAISLFLSNSSTKS